LLDEAARRASAKACQAAQAQVSRQSKGFENLFDGYDALLTPAAIGEAPLGLDSTGDASFNRIWTMLHMPCICVPVKTGPAGLPVGVQLVGRRNNDAVTLSAAVTLEAALAAYC
jgi:Asp-tRNA(Asn)/Glu-tRNA(Gln) amidotransferase A subunit family amidase